VTTPGRVDGSMTLLTEVMQRPLDPGYAAAAEQRREAAGADPVAARTRWLRRAPVTALAAVVVGVLLCAAILDLRLPGTDDARAVLLAEIDQRTATADAAERRADTLRREIEQAQAEALARDGGGVLEQARQLAAQAGSAPVAGPGVLLVLDNASDSGDAVGGDPRESEVDPGRVLDRDLQIVVNGLWASGAEAVAINGQRLTSVSSIREAGDAILVNFRPLSPPYTVQAIGDPQQLQTRLASSTAGGYLAYLQHNLGVRTSIHGEDRLTLPAAGTLRLRWAKPVEPATSTPTPPSGPSTIQENP
jgi:uncharacterized protein YlxW (UPF0749 family)